MAHIQELLDKARNSVSASQVFGEPYEKDGVTIIPVARVVGGGGGGYGGDDGGSGTGYGLIADPVGAYVISGEKVRWEPAVNVNKIVNGGLIVGAVSVITAPRIIKQARKLFAG